MKGENGNNDKSELMTENIKLKERLIALSQAKQVIKSKNLKTPDP